jgi:hypothetical protein
VSPKVYSDFKKGTTFIQQVEVAPNDQLAPSQRGDEQTQFPEDLCYTPKEPKDN